ncbi:STAS domain-containing protein [[Kitasatospora] papulosa]|uniref:STAS domain-containing protein n=1 Tax=[Kitasatospora] papulosa TaxID=1464011 RepID=UPI00382BA395
MHVTTMIDATTAMIIPDGDLDHTALPKLHAVLAALPQDVTEVVWDLQNTPFMDTAGLHLLVDPQPAAGPRRTTVTGIRPQPLALLHTAAEVFPTLGFTELLADAQPSQAA